MSNLFVARCYNSPPIVGASAQPSIGQLTVALGSYAIQGKEYASSYSLCNVYRAGRLGITVVSMRRNKSTREADAYARKPSPRRQAIRWTYNTAEGEIISLSV